MERVVRGMKADGFRGKRIHIAGSAPDKVDLEKLKYAHRLVKHLANKILSSGGGLVVTVGSEPVCMEDLSIPKIFDWSVLEAVDECQELSFSKWPGAQGAPAIAVGFGNWEERIPQNRKVLWERVIAGGRVELQVIPTELSVGGVMRQRQSMYGDILVTVGGHIGVHHLAQLYQANRKPVVPINLPLNTEKPTASEVLSNHVIKDPKDFFEYQPDREAVTAYSRLSLKCKLLDLSEFERRFSNFIGHLPQPIVFHVRLLNSKLQKFKVVEDFFRNVVDKVTANMGYRRFEMERDSSEEAFMNVELFQNLHFSSLVVADLTGVRPNCCMELGYALGVAKKVILTAMEGTKLPWDVDAIHCHFWSPKVSDAQSRAKLASFMKKNINRNPLVN
jgi:hypothetical protein